MSYRRLLPLAALAFLGALLLPPNGATLAACITVAVTGLLLMTDPHTPNDTTPRGTT